MKVLCPVVMLAAGLFCACAALVHQRFEPGMFDEVELAEGDAAVVAGRLLVLEKFTVLKYSSGRPRQFVSSVRLVGGGSEETAEISVNHPFRRGDSWIYQRGYDPETEATTVLQIVRDPWLGLASVGGILLILGAFIGLFADVIPTDCLPERRSGLRILAGVLTVMLPIFIIGRAMLRPEPPAALQSPLLAPHVAAYAASYLILLFAAFGIGRRLVPFGFFLMTLALTLGAVWGKICWGNWWQYDPKEMWSLATWLVYAAYLPLARNRWLETALRIAGAVLIILTLTWVNFSQRFSGLHTYALTGRPVLAEA